MLAVANVAQANVFASKSEHTTKPNKNEVKGSPFSAEALLSKSSTTTHRPSTATPKGTTPPRASPSTYAPPRASPLFSPSTSQSSSEKSRSSPWHTPVSSSSRPPSTRHAKSSAAHVLPLGHRGGGELVALHLLLGEEGKVL